MAQSRYGSGTRRVYDNRTASRRSYGSTRNRANAEAGNRPADKRVRQTKKKSRFAESFSEKGDIDLTLLLLIILIVAIGLIVMLSASAPKGKSMYDDSYYFFRRQLMWIVFGFVGMFAVSKMDISKWQKYIPLVFYICCFLLILVLIPHIGVKVNGSRRWLSVAGLQIQPSEFMKPIIAMYIADLVRRGQVDLKKLKGNFLCLIPVAFVALLLMLETHLSGTIIIVGIAVCVMLAGGTPLKPVLGLAAIAFVGIVVYLNFDATRMERVHSLFDPFADAQDSGYQISQSIYAIGSGRLLGLGLGQSVQKYSHLPEPYNDFIFSIVCEELGFVGGVVVILLFVALFLRAMTIAMQAPDRWSSLTCVGIASQIGIQAVLNMGVAVSVIPNTGVSLPFFSYGGTSLFTLLLEMGLLLNVSRKRIK